METTEPIQVKVGRTVRRLRQGRGLTQTQFCTLTGLDLKYLSGIENGKRNPSLQVIERLAGAFGIKVSEFLKMAEEI